ncbi:tetratricopeptide repeat protein [Lysobacter sp. F6437]|uniref:tetratricopeptide repeat protein n=1 Tax=Lysobacter sp. F6437 TaxID=3459296 RepID=UPI00403D6AC7
MKTCSLLALLRAPLLVAALATITSGPALAGAAVVTNDQLVADPASAWNAFLENAGAEAYDAYGALLAVGYGPLGVDALACREHREQLDAAVRLAPVSIALRRAAMMCAEATGQEEVAEAELAVLASLSRHAWSQASEVGNARPIRVLHAIDAYALLHASGLEFRYDYYAAYQVERYLPMVVAAWDPELDKEKLLSFDFVDAGYRLDRDSPFSGFPIQRNAIADAFIEGQAQAGESIAADIRAVRAARLAVSAEDKATAVRDAAAQGGILSGATWLVICQTRPFEGCGDGFVDAWLPYAEQKHVLPMVMLAYAYEHGLGVEADDAVGRQLLDAAVDLSYHGHAAVEYAQLWRATHEGRLPDALRQRLVDAERAGESNARGVLIADRVLEAGEEKAFVLSPGDIEYLSEPAFNGSGTGFSLIADYHGRRGEEQQRLDMQRRAASAGNPEHQFQLALTLIEQDAPGPGEAEGWALMASAAHGGSGSAQRYLAYESSRNGRWPEVEGWLLDAAQRGNVEAIFDLASLYEWEYPGVVGTVDRAVAAYTAMAAEEGGAEARRRLAGMAIAGRGMEKNLGDAKAWLLADAEKGDHESQALLGSMLLRGELGSVDEAEGLRWMKLALAASNPSAYVDYGAWLYYFKNTAESRLEAIGVWEEARTKDIPLATNNLAWARCTSPDAAIFDPARGMEAAASMGTAEHMGAAQLDTLAACHAAAGEFERARELQTQAIELVALYPQIGGDEEEATVDPAANLAGYQGRLALYVSGKHYVETERF